MIKSNSFDEIVQELHLPLESLRVEKIITSSMNNYVININCEGVTWALVVRYPKHDDSEKFVKEKERTIAIAEYLASILEKGIEITSDNIVTFIGKSFLVDAASVKSFIKQQSTEPSLIIQNSFAQNEKKVQGVAVPEEYLTYNGPYFLTRGAPANETLEHDFSFAELFLKSLAILHTKTGAKQCLPEEELAKKLEQAHDAFIIVADSWEPDRGSTEEKRIREYKERYGNDTFLNVKREVFLQSNKSTMFLNELLEKFFSYEINSPQFHSFVHGDMHGANFIIVQYDYILEESNVFLDRTLLNTIFQCDKTLNIVTIEYEGEKMIYREYHKGDESKTNCVVTKRGKHNEIHFIDIDTGKGIIESEKSCYLYDVLVLSFSIMHWSYIHKKNVNDFSFITQYTEMFHNTLWKQ